MTRERILKEAALAENAVRYQVLAASAGLAGSLIGIPTLPVAVPNRPSPRPRPVFGSRRPAGRGLGDRTTRSGR